MVSQTVDAPEIVDQEVVSEETETPAAVEVVESAAPDETIAATPDQLQVTEPEKPDYITRADWERERTEVAQRAASDALESDRRRRQTENARKAKQELDSVARRERAADTLRVSLGAKGIYEMPDEAATTAWNRAVRDEVEHVAGNALDTVDEAWDYLTAPAYGKQVDLDDSFELAAKRLAPKVQHLVDTIRPTIEKQAREGYTANADLGKWYEAETARRNAKGREGKEELKRVEGTPSSAIDRSLEAVTNRIISNDADDKDREFWNARFGRK